MSKPLARRGQRGFTLVEMMIGMVVFVVGALGVYSMIVYGIHLQSYSKDMTTANALAKAKLEQLRVVAPSDPERSFGGRLDDNVANHFDAPTGTPFVRRWVVTAGPAGTQDITVAVVPITPNPRLPRVQHRTLLP